LYDYDSYFHVSLRKQRNINVLRSGFPIIIVTVRVLLLLLDEPKKKTYYSLVPSSDGANSSVPSSSDILHVHCVTVPGRFIAKSCYPHSGS